MDWSNDTVIEFLEGYRSEPCIWDPRNPQYKNRNAVNEAWERIRDSLSVSFTVGELKKKKESLMASFRGLLNKKKNSIKAGAAPEEVYTPSWFAYSLMESFLGPIYKYNAVVSEEGPDPIATVSETDVIPNNERNLKHKNESELKRAKRQMENAVHTIFKSIEQNREEDDCALYGRLLAQKLRRIPERRRETLMLEIDGLVIKAKYECANEQILNSPSMSMPTSEDLGKHLISNAELSHLKGEILSNPASPYDLNDAE
nr:unnamed protein product [Callosobruchus chinensis]